ncbi:MAG: PfkB family carbohydrate kinase [bacterium]
MPEIMIIGDVTVDHFITIPDNYAETEDTDNNGTKELLLPFGEKVPVDNVEMHCGGNAANIAIGLKRLGINSYPIIPVGKDTSSIFCLSALEKENVVIDYNYISDENICNTSYILRFHGERTILSHHNKKIYFIPDTINTPYIYYSSHDGDNNQLSIEVLKQISDQSSKLIFAPGNTQIKGDKNILETLISKSYLTICNKEEAYKILSIIDGSDIDAIKMLYRLAHMGSHHVVITDGGNGVYFLDGETGEIGHFPSTIGKNDIVDSTGAGDAMCTSVIYKFIKDESLAEGVKFGLMNSASVLKYIGAQAGLLSSLS